jgi:hypothetical protein
VHKVFIDKSAQIKSCKKQNIVWKFYPKVEAMFEDSRQGTKGEEDLSSHEDLKSPQIAQTNETEEGNADPNNTGVDQEETENPGIAGTGMTWSGLRDKTANTVTNTEMEVHHHPQLEHKPKPWKEYLLEGLMIFIAVMMGFIAENIREGITDREHVKELASQLVKDLKDDTLQLNKIYQAEAHILDANDTLVHLLQFPLEKGNVWRLLQLIVRSHDLWLFHPSAGAISAIKNELHLKQFSNSKMIGFIAEYEKHIDLIQTVQGITLQYQRNYLDPFLLQHFTAAGLDAAFNELPGIVVEVRNLTPGDLIQLGSDMVLVRINTNELLRDNLALKADALNLLQYINTQYNP